MYNALYVKASSKVLPNYFIDTPLKKNIQFFKCLSQVLNIRPYQPQAFNINHKGCQSTSGTLQRVLSEHNLIIVLCLRCFRHHMVIYPGYFHSFIRSPLPHDEAGHLCIIISFLCFRSRGRRRLLRACWHKHRLDES